MTFPGGVVGKSRYTTINVTEAVCVCVCVYRGCCGVGVGMGMSIIILCGCHLCNHSYGVKYTNVFFTSMATKLQLVYSFTSLAIFSSSTSLWGSIQ